MEPTSQDPRLKPTPDYGSLGPGTNVPADGPVPLRTDSRRMVLAILVGVVLALPLVAAGSARTAWEEVAKLLSITGKPNAASPAVLSEHERERLDRSSPQAQAELLLERAINHYDGATDQIASRVDGWHGKLKPTQRVEALFTTALNSNDLRVRAAGIEVDLAAFNIAKTPASVERLNAQVESGDQSAEVWALWMLGLLGNRGVERERVGQILLSHIHDPNEQVRVWAVEGLAHLGTDEVIAPLLQVFHDDPSPSVRDRAACSLAQSGMLNEQQRRSAIPQLLDFADDGSLDGQTHTWVYQALRDITGQNLPNDAAAWRNWYASHSS